MGNAKLNQITGVTLTSATAVDRSGTDYYPTPNDVTIALAARLGLNGVTVWEPACGAGHMAKALISSGAKVTASELHFNGYGDGGVDFLTAEPRGCDWIITNPPFKLAEQFIRRCIEHGRPFAMLLKSQYWHSSRRKNLFEAHRPELILPLTWRPDFQFGAKGGSPTMDVLWTVWGGASASSTTYEPLAKPMRKLATPKDERQPSFEFLEVA